MIGECRERRLDGSLRLSDMIRGRPPIAMLLLSVESNARQWALGSPLPRVTASLRTDIEGAHLGAYGARKEVLDLGPGFEVNLNHREVKAVEFFDDCLDHGDSIHQAADKVETFGRRTTSYDPDFITYLRT